jgi:glycosyltransferase involved in cell wall biosynthesis
MYTTSIVIFGPTLEGAHAFELIKENYNVIAFCDNDTKKHGTKYLDIPIIGPCALKNYGNDLTIVIANYKYEASISFQILSMGVDNAYLFRKGRKNYYLMPICNDRRESYLSMMKEIYGRYSHADTFKISTHNSVYDVNSSRVFNFTFFKYGGECGGPSGVMFRLQRANRQLSAIGNDFYIFGDKVILPSGTEKQSPTYMPKCNDIFSAIFELWESHFSAQLSYNDMKILDDRLIWMQVYMCRLFNLHQEINFTPNDVYIFHDVEAAFIFSSLFSFSSKALVYHAQGGMYYEYLACGGEPSEGLSITWELMHEYCLYTVKKRIFPSLGGYDSLIKTAPRLKDACIDYDIILNGCNIYTLSPSDEIKCLLGNFLHPDSIKFVTIAMVNDAKAIERIPELLGDMRRRYDKNIQWVMVGSGPNDEILSGNIERNELEDNVLWIKERQDHVDIQYILDVCDYYIILQKYSICDFATIEAMGRGCIPILSDVPGNIAYLSYNNGFAIKNYNESTSLIDFISSGNKCSLSQLNIDVQREHFSEKSFLNKYAELASDLKTSDYQ